MSAITVEIDPTQSMPQQYIGTDEDGPQYRDMTMQEAIVQVAAERLFKACVEEARERVREAVGERIEREIKARLEEYVHEALSRPLTITDGWGHPTKKGTLRELIVEHAEAQLVIAERRGYASNDTVLTKVVKDEIDHALKAELTKAVQQAKAKLTTELERTASQVIAQTITKGLSGVVI